MKRRIRVTRLLLWLSLFEFVTPGFAGQVQAPRVSEEARDFKTFTDRVQAYVKMQKDLEASLPPLKPTKDAAQIVEHQHALARKIADARRDARQGDIFTHEVTERFRKIIRRAFQGPEGWLARQTIQQDSAFKVIVLHVNDVCPENIPLTTTPRAMASEVLAEPHVIDRVTDASGTVLYKAPRRARQIPSNDVRLIQEGLRGVVRLPEGTAHVLDGRDFPIPVMRKTGTTSDFRDALFVGSTYGPKGITVAVRIGFDDNSELGKVGEEGDRGTHSTADLPRDHAPRLQGPARGAAAAVPPRDRGRDRRVPGDAGRAGDGP